MTWPRITDLVATYAEARRQDLFEVGVAMSLAMNEPKKLKTLLKSTAQSVEATGMLKIPKKPSGG